MTRLTDTWLTAPATQRVCRLLTDAGAQALFVGGCVRNALLGVPVSDLDIATDAVPERVMELAGQAGIKAIPTGIAHGTVTLMSGGIPHEITTFRRDVATDGRRAVVAFSGDVAEDAARRDFTMNALYARPDGTVIDPLQGLPDLVARRVRFIGEASERIREDYLRSLRYFRFHAWYGDADQGLDAGALAAIASHLDGLHQLSRERVGAEMLKLLGARDPAPSVAAMRSTGVLGALLAGTDDRALAPLIHVELALGLRPDPIRRLAALGDLETVSSLRLSKAQGAELDRVRNAATSAAGAGELGYRLKQDAGLSALALRCALFEQPPETQAISDIKMGSRAVFPVSAKDLMPDLSGPQLGAKLAELETKWIASGFRLSTAELLGSE